MQRTVSKVIRLVINFNPHVVLEERLLTVVVVLMKVVIVLRTEVRLIVHTEINRSTATLHRTLKHSIVAFKIFYLYLERNVVQQDTTIRVVNVIVERVNR